jgi:hypothetical protein
LQYYNNNKQNAGPSLKRQRVTQHQQQLPQVLPAALAHDTPAVVVPPPQVPAPAAVPAPVAAAAALVVPANVAPVVAADIELDTTHLDPRFKVEHEGYWRMYDGKFVFQLRTLIQPYTAFQGTKKCSPGASVTINMSALTDNAQDLQLITAQSSVVCAISGNTTQTLVYSVEMLGYNAVTGDCVLKLTATAQLYMQLAQSYMQLATAIRKRTDKA